MRNIVIAGSSGLGKTFLEEELEKRGVSFQLPKYFDREARASERRDKNIPLSREEWKKSDKEFFFKLSYNGYNYGWKESDKREGGVSIAITLKDLEEFLKENNDFVPVLLWMREENFKVLERRMRERGESEEKIAQRMELTKRELEEIEKYKNIVKSYEGLIFEIKDDRTIFKEVIPEIESLVR